MPLQHADQLFLHFRGGQLQRHRRQDGVSAHFRSRLAVRQVGQMVEMERSGNGVLLECRTETREVRVEPLTSVGALTFVQM